MHEANADFKDPDFRFAAHGGKKSISYSGDILITTGADAIGSVSFHPWKAQLLSASGSRHWQEEVGSSEEDDEGSEDSEGEATSASRMRRELVSLDSSIKLWDWSV